MSVPSQFGMRRGASELGGATTACHWGQTMFGECMPFSYISNIPFQLHSGQSYTIDELELIFSDARFVNWSVTVTTPGLNGQRVVRASKIYPNSWRLLYWNAYEKYRPGNRVSAERIPSRALLRSLQMIMAYEFQSRELEIVDDMTNERIYINFDMGNLPAERFIGIDAAAMFDQGSARGRRGGL
jgi:hypothetical protein